MSPLNRGPLLGPRAPPAGIWAPPPPRFSGRLPPPGMPPRMLPPPMSGVFGPMRQRLPPPPRPGGAVRPGGPMPLFPPRSRGIAPLPPPMGLRPNGPRGPHMQGWPRRILPPQMMSHMRPRFAIGNGVLKNKTIANAKKVSKLEELELKKPWMTDEIRSEIQKKNKLYAKAKKNKDAKEWEEFKDLRNKVTRMIRDAKNEYLAKHSDQGGKKTDDKNTNESEGVQKTENATEQSEQMEQTEETQPSSEQAHLYPDDEPYDQRDENYVSSEEEECYYCEVCDKEFALEDKFLEHKQTHKLCGIDGCTFSAHPLLVQKHITMQHSSGLYHRIKNLSTPEDIQKWIAERKMNYPTKVNVELREAKDLEKKQRGELIRENQDSTNSKKTLNTRNRKRKPRKRHANVVNNELLCTEEIYRGLRPFPGISCLYEEDTVEVKAEMKDSEESRDEKHPYDVDINISDEEELPQVPVQPSPVNISISSLVANYESESSEDDGPEEVPIKKIKTDIEETTDSVLPSSSKTEDIKVESELNTSNVSNAKCDNIQKVQLDKNYGKKDLCNTKKTYPKKSHLLERLLSRSIQHERNLICQCIKYIVDNNFFE